MTRPTAAPLMEGTLNRMYRLAHRIRRLAWRVFQPTTMGVKVIVQDRDGRVLLVKARYLDMWTFPGGGVHKRETPEAAAVRELREETGIRAAEADVRLIGLLSSFKEGKSDYVAMFACDASADASPSARGEIAETAFFAVDALPEAASERTRRRINEFLGGEVMRGVW